MNIISSAKTLVISFIGLQSQEVDIKPVVKIMLKSDSEQLDEVMVVAYGTAKKSSFTGSATSIKSKQITSGSRESLDKAFSGKMAGVRVASATGDPGCNTMRTTNYHTLPSFRNVSVLARLLVT